MDAEIRIRQARVSETETLTDLAMRSKAVWGYDRAFMELCRDELTVRPAAITGGEIWVADRQGVAVGFAELVLDGRCAEIEALFVDPDCVRCGVGSALWCHLETRAVSLAAEVVCTDADPNAIGFYRSVGMEVVGRSPSGSIPGRYLPRMAKQLAGAEQHNAGLARGA